MRALTWLDQNTMILSVRLEGGLTREPIPENTVSSATAQVVDAATGQPLPHPDIVWPIALQAVDGEPGVWRARLPHDLPVTRTGRYRVETRVELQGGDRGYRAPILVWSDGC